MKATFELPDSDLQEIRRLTGERKKGPAIRKFVQTALMMNRRQEIAEKFISGEWGVRLHGFEAASTADRKKDRKRETKWRG